MPVFAICAKEDEKISATIETVYKDAHRKVWHGLWFVFDDVTTQQVGEKLGIGDGSKGQIFICSTSANYWGYGPKDAWEWLALKRNEK